MSIDTDPVIAIPSLSEWDITHIACCEHAYEFEQQERLSILAFCGKDVTSSPMADIGTEAVCLPCGAQARKRQCPEYGTCPYLTR